jgi:mRNA-degrading endonuclease RelE of RelBE toxin-antitoxin system
LIAATHPIDRAGSQADDHSSEAISNGHHLHLSDILVALLARYNVHRKLGFQLPSPRRWFLRLSSSRWHLMPHIVIRPSFIKDLDGLRRSSRKHYQRASEVLLEIQRDIEPSAPRRADNRIPKCYKYELPDGYRLVLQLGDSGATMVALAVGKHDHVDSFLNGHRGYVFDEKPAS